MPGTHSQKKKTFSSRRRLLRLGVYAPPAVLGAMMISQQNAWASGEDKSSDGNSSGGGGNASCAPCFCAPCGRSGSKNSKECDDKKQGCTSESGNSHS